MKAIDLDPEAQTSPAGAGVGERLVAAREALGLDAGDVVRLLRLPASTLQALESDRHEKLPAPVFVHGYLRAYARLLELDGEALVAEYDRLASPPEPVITPDTGIHRRATARDRYLRGAVGLFVVAMLALLGSWWYNQPDQDVPAPSRTALSENAQPASPVSEPSPSQIDTSNPDQEVVAALAPDNPPQAPASEAAEDNGAATGPETPSGDTATEAEPVLHPANDSLASANTAAQEPKRDPGTTPSPAVSNLPIAPLATERGDLVRASRAPTGGEVIIIKAHGESWAEVVDANGYQLLYYLLRPGMEQRLQGRAPFQVFLGNAQAVALDLDHERFDHTPYQRRNNTARFSIGGRQ